MKIIVCGDVKGKFGLLSKKLSSIIAKTGACEIAFCVGEFFGDMTSYEQLLDSTFKFPLQTYVLGPCSEQTASYIANPDERADLCPNLTYLGKSGLFSTYTKLKIFHVSGIEDSPDGSNHSNKGGDKDGSYHFNARDLLPTVRSIASAPNFKGVDVLLTSQWPALVDKRASKLDHSYTGSRLISHIAALLKPRYHFSGLEDFHYERVPYRNHVILIGKEEHSTRFISLASLNNLAKQKFIYAFNLEAMEAMPNSDLVKQPYVTTQSPYLAINFENDNLEESAQQFFYQERKRGKDARRGGGVKKFKSSVDIAPDSCWFCLANPKVEKHMVVSVGEHCYLAMAKGGLTNDHTLIIPINHHQSSVTVDDDIMQEIETYKEALKKFFSTKDKVVVFYERNYKSAHLQLQAVPLPLSTLPSIHSSITTIATSNNISLVTIPDRSILKQIVSPPNSAYFAVQMPNGERLFTQVQRGFPLQFGRSMLCQEGLLSEPGRFDWRACVVEGGQQEEEGLCEQFRKQFKAFDPFG